MLKDIATSLHPLFLYHPKPFAKLLSRINNRQDLDAYLPSFLAEHPNLNVTQVQVQKQLDQTSKILKKLDQHQAQVLTLLDPHYPSQLKEIEDPPPVLYLKGNPSLLNSNCLGVVGTRKVTQYGKTVASTLCTQLAPHLLITSGMAQGVDSVAHQTALSVGCPTIAVVGTGLDIVFPSSNQGLAKDIEKNGLMVSEFPLGTRGFAHHFPMRNRIISGLSLGVLIVEAAPKSGSLITARLAMEQNREVFAVPGPITSEYSQGPHQLIQDGAKLTMMAEDVLEELQFLSSMPLFPTPAPKPKPSLSEGEDKVYSELQKGPASVDELSAKTQLPVSQVLQYLTFFELENLAECPDGLRYALCP